MSKIVYKIIWILMGAVYFIPLLVIIFITAIILPITKFNITETKWFYWFTYPLVWVEEKVVGEMPVDARASQELWQSMCMHNGAIITNTGASGSKCAACGKELF